MKEICIRCGKETEFDIHTPVDRRKYYIDGSGQLCEDCWKRVYGEIKTKKLPSPATPTTADQDLYRAIINKTTLAEQDREELARLYQKYIR